MAKLASIVREAKRIKKLHPHKYDRKANPWSQGYIVEASQKLKKPKRKKKAATHKPKRRKVGARKKTVKRKPVKRKAAKRTRARKSPAKKQTRRRKRTVVTKTVSRRTVGAARRRSVSGKSNLGMMLGIGALALGAWYIYNQSKKPQLTYPNLNQALLQTNNVQRNQQTSDIVSYAVAAGFAVDAITKLIDSLNKKSDSEVNQITSSINATGEIPSYVWVA